MLNYFKERIDTNQQHDSAIGLINNRKPDKPVDDDHEVVCRICLGEEDDPATNPLFSPCMCAGSMGLIHLQCLKEWLRLRKIQR
jgi:E3 ubiquitin-protein ligase DOA10